MSQKAPEKRLLDASVVIIGNSRCPLQYVSIKYTERLKDTGVDRRRPDTSKNLALWAAS
jgi:hypothetical protein